MAEQTKKCNKCNKILPNSAFSKCYQSKDGLQYQCKECRKLYRLNSLDLKYCDVCNKKKPKTDFYESRIEKDGKFPTCKECLSKRGII